MAGRTRPLLWLEQEVRRAARAGAGPGARGIREQTGCERALLGGPAAGARPCAPGARQRGRGVRGCSHGELASGASVAPPWPCDFGPVASMLGAPVSPSDSGHRKCSAPSSS